MVEQEYWYCYSSCWYNFDTEVVGSLPLCVNIVFRMPWSQAQRSRLALERKLLKERFPEEDITWIHPHENTKVEIKISTNRDNSYKLRVYIPEDFPNSVPEMVVCDSPNPMPEWNESHINHTLMQREGFVNICHHYYRRWSPNKNKLWEVFKKGRLWLEAYESSLETGKSMNFYLDDIHD